MSTGLVRPIFRYPSLVVIALGVAMLLWSFAYALDVSKSLQAIASDSNYQEILPSDSIRLDLRYATTNNFVGENMYGDFNRAFLHRRAAEKLKKAARLLQKSHPGYRLVIFDALRPRSVQFLLWNKVKGTDKQSYVANPSSGSIHNYGFAVDLTVEDQAGNELDMGTGFDDFTPLAQPRKEAEFLRSGRLTELQVSNRKLLRAVMEQAGFIQLPVEWWHFDALPKNEVKKSYRIVE